MKRASRHSYLFRATLAVLAWLNLSLGAAAADIAVVCIGSDGHIALETAIAGECAALTEADQPVWPEGVSLSATAADDHCGPCIDIAASAANHPQKILLVSGNRSLSDCAQASLPLHDIQVMRLTRDRQIPASTAPPSPHLASLRTVILLN